MNIEVRHRWELSHFSISGESGKGFLANYLVVRIDFIDDAYRLVPAAFQKQSMREVVDRKIDG